MAGPLSLLTGSQPQARAQLEDTAQPLSRWGIAETRSVHLPEAASAQRQIKTNPDLGRGDFIGKDYHSVGNILIIGSAHF